MILLNNEIYKKTMFCTDPEELRTIMNSLIELADDNSENDLYVTEVYKAILNLISNDWLYEADFIHIIATVPTILYDALGKGIKPAKVINVVFDHFPQYLFNPEFEINSSLLYLIMTYDLTNAQKYVILKNSLENYANARHVLAIIRKFPVVPANLYEELNTYCDSLPDKKLKIKLSKAIDNVVITEPENTQENHGSVH